MVSKEPRVLLIPPSCKNPDGWRMCPRELTTSLHFLPTAGGVLRGKAPLFKKDKLWAHLRGGWCFRATFQSQSKFRIIIPSTTCIALHTRLESLPARAQPVRDPVGDQQSGTEVRVARGCGRGEASAVVSFVTLCHCLVLK